MAVKMEPIIKEWYDYLKNGKIMGRKCPECGNIEFPPVPVCNKCGCMETEWTEMSGEGELYTFSFSPMGVMPYNTEPTVSGFCKLKEGMFFDSMIVNAQASDQGEILEELKKGPIPFELEITELDENISFPKIRLKRGKE